MWICELSDILSIPSSAHNSRNQLPSLSTKNPDDRSSYCNQEGTNAEGLNQGRGQEDEEKEMRSTGNEEDEVPGGS